MPTSVWVATAKIYLGQPESATLGYTPGQRVPDSVVAAYDLSGSGLVQAATIEDDGTSKDYRGVDPVTVSEVEARVADALVAAVVNPALPAGTYTPNGTWLAAARNWTLAGNIVIGAPAAPANTAVVGVAALVLRQPMSGGPFTVTWPPALKWFGGASAPVMPTSPGAELIIHLFWSGSRWSAVVMGVTL